MGNSCIQFKAKTIDSQKVTVVKPINPKEID